MDGHSLCWHWDFCKEKHEREWGTSEENTPVCFLPGDQRDYMRRRYAEEGHCLALVELGIEE